MSAAEALRTAERLADNLASAGSTVAATTRRTPSSVKARRSPHRREALRLVGFLLVVALMIAMMKNLDALTDLAG
jgi:ferric-dicitrate binding protein FerR (iron transport regulator)